MGKKMNQGRGQQANNISPMDKSKCEWYKKEGQEMTHKEKMERD